MPLFLVKLFFRSLPRNQAKLKLVLESELAITYAALNLFSLELENFSSA